MNISASNLAIDTQGCYSCKQTPIIERTCGLKVIHPAGEWKKAKEKCVSTRRGDACIDLHHSHSIRYFNYFDQLMYVHQTIISTMLYYCKKKWLYQNAKLTLEGCRIRIRIPAPRLLAISGLHSRSRAPDHHHSLFLQDNHVPKHQFRDDNDIFAEMCTNAPRSSSDNDPIPWVTGILPKKSSVDMYPLVLLAHDCHESIDVVVYLSRNVSCRPLYVSFWVAFSDRVVMMTRKHVVWKAHSSMKRWWCHWTIWMRCCSNIVSSSE